MNNACCICRNKFDHIKRCKGKKILMIEVDEKDEVSFDYSDLDDSADNYDSDDYLDFMNDEECDINRRECSICTVYICPECISE